MRENGIKINIVRPSLSPQTSFFFISPWRHGKMEILLFESPHGRFLNTFVYIRGRNKLDVISWLHQINFYSAREHSRACVSIHKEVGHSLSLPF